MPLMKCPERGCGNQVSTSAESCPRCGLQIQHYFHTSLEKSSVGIPLDPVRYWNNWHFWYLWGCPSVGTDLEYTSNAWIERGDLLFKLGSMEIFSPFSGLVVNSCSCLDALEVGGNYSSSNFFEMRILRGTFHENIGYIYSSVLDYIEKVAHKERPGTITGFFNRMGLGIGLDAKGKFSSQGELLAFARNLKKVKAVNLPLK